MVKLSKTRQIKKSIEKIKDKEKNDIAVDFSKVQKSLKELGLDFLTPEQFHAWMILILDKVAEEQENQKDDKDDVQ